MVFANGGLSSLRRSSPVGLPFRACEGGPFLLLDLSGDPACQTRLQRIQFTGFIYHLTNSNGCGNLLRKVVLTVSPLRPFLFPQPRVFSANHRFLSTLFSYSYKSLFPQPFSFHIHTKPRGCWGDLNALLSRHSFTPIFEGSLATRHFPFIFSNLQPLLRKTGGYGVHSD